MEIEIKAILTKEEFERCKEKIGTKDHNIRKDRYWSKYKSFEEAKQNNEPAIRTATVEEPGFISLTDLFTLKRKNIIDNKECNEETETEVEDINVIESFLRLSDYNIIWSKAKEKYGAYYWINSKYTLHAELEIVSKTEDFKDPIYAIEIECCDAEESDSKEIWAAETKLLEDFGISKDRINSDSWRVLLGDKK